MNLQRFRVLTLVTLLLSISITGTLQASPKEKLSCTDRLVLFLRGESLDPHEAIKVLSEENRLQELTWLHRKRGNIEESEEVERRIYSTLKNKSFKVLKKMRKGISGANLVEFPNSIKAIYKRSFDSHANDSAVEEAVYQIDRMLGLDITPVTVKRNTELGESSFQYFIETKKIRTVEELHSVKQERKIILLDLLVGNSDRHGGNIIEIGKVFGKYNKIVAIDHGACFDPHFPIKLPESLDLLAVPQRNIKALKELNQEGLEQILEGLISKSNIEVILKRRDLILELLRIYDYQSGTYDDLVYKKIKREIELNQESFRFHIN